jgi:polyisoprenoid-binding protein YceI
MATAQAESTIPTGTWQSDPAHSSAGFSVKHVVGTFKGHFDEFEATLSDLAGEAKLTGRSPVSSIQIKDGNIRTHLLSPEFFDAERHPELSFDSSGISTEDGQLVVEGELTMKGITRRVVARGDLSGPAPGPGDTEKLGLDLEATVDRHDYDMNWQMDLPGGGKTLGDEVTLTVHLELTKE